MNRTIWNIFANGREIGHDFPSRSDAVAVAREMARKNPRIRYSIRQA